MVGTAKVSGAFTVSTRIDLGDQALIPSAGAAGIPSAKAAGIPSAGAAGIAPAGAAGQPRAKASRPSRTTMLLWFGIAALTIPTIIKLAQEYWSQSEGGHGPIVLATGIWLLWRGRRGVAAVATPGDGRITALLMVPALIGYVLARMTGMLGVECLGLYVALVALLYDLTGWRGVRFLSFPLIYLLFLFPQPETLILPFSQKLKLGLSSAAVWLLSTFGYEVGRGGVIIYVEQYELLVAKACSGLNSLIGLGAIGTFYAYTRYEGNWRAAAPLLLALAPIAVVANFIRVIILILVTYHFGDAVAQLYVHDVAAILLFTVAVLMMIGADAVIDRIRRIGTRRNKAA
jgi:exosortase